MIDIMILLGIALVILEVFYQCSHHRARRWSQKQLYGQKCVLDRIDSDKGSQGVQADQTACPLVVYSRESFI